MNNQTNDNKEYKVVKVSRKRYYNPSERECHLCMDCANAYPSKCQKISDRLKKPYEEYGFIKAARQTFDENNNVLDFAVKKCDNYEYVEPNTNVSRDKKKLKELKRLRGAIAAYYFETSTADEAYLIQAELEERGHFKPAERLNAKTVETIRQRVRNAKKM